MRNRRRNDKWLVAATAVFALLAAVFWRPVQTEVLAWLVLHSDTASEAVVDEVASQSTDPLPWLEQLWRSDKIPHRLLAVSYLKRNAGQNNNLFDQAESLLLEAAGDGDFEVRKLALETLAEHHHPELVPLATAQLRDVDPRARLLGLSLLRSNGRDQLVPVVIPLLDDPDPRVVVAAAGALRRWAGLDFGIRFRQIALTQQANQSKESSLEKGGTLAQGVERWKEWWTLHHADYPVQPSLPALASSSWRLPAADSRLVDLEGKPVRLADFKGKAVLLNFWSNSDPESLADQSALQAALVELQRRNAGRLVVLGISLDGAGFDSCCVDHDHSHADESQLDAGQICVLLKQFVVKRGINFHVLLDPKGEAAGLYHVSELPTCVLIDPDGYIRRRFAGGRGFDTLNAMLNEIVRPEQASQSKMAAETERGKR